MEDTQETKYCTNCKQQIASSNYVMHELHCHRHLVLCKHCDEPVTRSQLQEHYDETHQPQPCPLCNQQFEVSKLQKHQDDECPKRPGKCEYCELEMPRDSVTEHEEYCGTRTERCPTCQQYVMVKDLDRHVTSGCAYPPKPVTSPSRPDPDVLMPDEFYNNFAMDEMSRILNSDILRPSPAPRRTVRRPVETKGTSANSHLTGATGVTRNNTNTRYLRNKPTPRQPMSHRQTSNSTPSNLAQERNSRRRLNVLQAETTHLKQRPNNQHRNSREPQISGPDDDLDALLACHLAQDLGDSLPSHKHNLLNQDDDDDEFLLPCEFCGENYPSEALIQHQGMCAVGASEEYAIRSSHSANEISSLARQSNRNTRSQWRTMDDDVTAAAGDLNNSTPSHCHQSPPLAPQIVDNLSREADYNNDEIMLPCEFCDNLFPEDVLVQHQAVCDASNSSPRSQSPVRPEVGASRPVKYVRPLASNTRQVTGPAYSKVTSKTNNTRGTFNDLLQQHTSNPINNSRGMYPNLLYQHPSNSAAASVSQKDKDNLARQNLRSQKTNNIPVRADSEKSSDLTSASRTRRREALQQNGASSYQPSFANPSRTAPKLVNKSRNTRREEGLDAVASRSNPSKSGPEQTPNTRNSRTRSTQGAQGRKYPQLDK